MCPDIRTQLDYEELYESFLDRERARIMEQRSRRESEILLRGLRILGNSTSAESGLLSILSVLDGVESLDGSLVLTESDRGCFEVYSSTLPDLRSASWPRGPMFNRLFSRNKPVIIHDTGQVPEWRERSGSSGRSYLSAIHAPFLFGECKAVLTCVSRELGSFNYRQAQLLYHLCPLMTQALLTIRTLNELQQTQKELESALERVTFLAQTDSLTQLQNRRRFYELAEREIRRALRFDYPISLIMLDIDNFKALNDYCGHDVGDTALKTVASTCAPELREHDLLARFGGEEFLALLPETPEEEARQAADRLRQRIENNQMAPELSPGQLTISLGLAQLRPEDSGVDSLMRRADRALQQAKQRGKNRLETKSCLCE